MFVVKVDFCRDRTAVRGRRPQIVINLYFRSVGPDRRVYINYIKKIMIFSRPADLFLGFAVHFQALLLSASIQHAAEDGKPGKMRRADRHSLQRPQRVSRHQIPGRIPEEHGTGPTCTTEVGRLQGRPLRWCRVGVVWAVWTWGGYGQ